MKKERKRKGEGCRMRMLTSGDEELGNGKDWEGKVSNEIALLVEGNII